MPASLKLCTCPKCSIFRSPIAGTNEQVKGVYVTRAVYREHQQAKVTGKRKHGNGGEVDFEEVEAAAMKATLEDTAMDVDDDLMFTSGRSAQTSPAGRENEAPDAHLNAASQDELRDWDRELRQRNHAFEAVSAQIDIVHFESGDPTDLVTIPPLVYASNREILEYQHFLESLQRRLRGTEVEDEGPLSNLKVSMETTIEQDLQYLRRAISRAWEAHKVRAAQGSATNPVPIIPRERRQQTTRIAEPLLAYLIAVVCLGLIDGLSRNGCGFILVLMRGIVATSCAIYVRKCGIRNADRLPDPLTLVGNGDPWPRDFRSAMDALEIDPDTVTMACCKECRDVFPPTSDTNAPYPAVCPHQEYPDSPMCGAKLVKIDAEGKQVPIYPFLYQPMESWLNRLLSRKGIVDQIEEVTRSWAQGAATVKDMLWGSSLQGLLGHDGKPFMAAPAGELRLAFTLNVDWFNPFGRRTAGKHASVGGIYMVCMNLPIHLRYRVENVYLVGIIPGPSEPNVDQMNPVFRPLVDSLLRFWQTGVYFAHTASHPHGCLVRAIIAALVCDIPGMRKVAGFAGHSANLFCSFCKLLKNQIHNLDRDSWTPRTREGHMEDALKYKRAADKRTRKQEFEENGVRWSELLRLPYWNPLEFAVVDSMHNLFLNNCKNHCRKVWGMDSSVAPHKKMKPHDSNMQRVQLQAVHDAIEAGQKSEATKARKSYLEAFVALNAVAITAKNPTKDEIAEELIEWRRKNPAAPFAIPQPIPYPIYNYPRPGDRKDILDAIVLGEVVDDIKKTTLPSWIAAPSQNIGTKKQGKLSADQWRVLCTVSLVITLVRLWGEGGEQATSRKWLDNFLALVTAIKYATKRSTTEESITIVDDHLQLYLKGLVELFSRDVLTVNHHLSLHLPAFLRRLGPVHGWWTFAFERYNGIIQRFNTNNRFGELEGTFMRTFCRGGNLKAMIYDLKEEEDDSLLGTLRKAFDQYFSTQFRGTLKNDLLSLGADGNLDTSDEWTPNQKEFTLPDSVYTVLSSKIASSSANASHNRRVQHLKRLKIGGVDYTASANSKGNAEILFRTRDAGGTWTNVAGRIDSIFRHQHTPIAGQKTVVTNYMVVRKYQELDEQLAQADPYRRYPLLDVRVYYDTFEDTPFVVTKDEVVTHVATCPLMRDTQNLRVILNLDRS